MANEALEQLYVQGLRARHIASGRGSASAAAILQAPNAPELKSQLEEGSRIVAR